MSMDEFRKQVAKHPECVAGRAECVEKEWLLPVSSQRQHYVDWIFVADDGRRAAMALCGYMFSAEIVFKADPTGPFKPCERCKSKLKQRGI